MSVKSEPHIFSQGGSELGAHTIIYFVRLVLE